MVEGLDHVSEATVAIQGYGNAGAIAARLFDEVGATIIAVSDSQGGIYAPDGLDPTEVLAHKHETGSVVDFGDTERISNEDLLPLPCDILIPAALENQIRADNAADIRAQFVVEAANGPTTSRADQILFERGIPVLPDILANAGSVTVSYFEWVQNIENEQWDLDRVNRKLSRKMERATEAVLEEQRNRPDGEWGWGIPRLGGPPNGGPHSGRPPGGRRDPKARPLAVIPESCGALLNLLPPPRAEGASV